MITADISRFMDEDVHRSAHAVCVGQCGQCGWVQWFGIFDSSLAINYRRFGSDRRKLVDNAYAATRQWRHSSMTSISPSPPFDNITAVFRLRNDLYCVEWGVKLYSLTHWAKSMGEGDFRPSTARTPRPIFMKLEIYNYFPDTTPQAKFQGPTSTWVVWANSQFDARKFLSFFSFLRHAHKSNFWTHPNAQYVIIRRFRQGSAFWA